VARDGIDGDGASLARRAREFEREGEDGDVVEPVADLGDDLPRPQVPEVGVAPEQLPVGHFFGRAPPSASFSSR
jgi:hypothetical protein